MARRAERAEFGPVEFIEGSAEATIEATAVLPEARITYADVGLWNDATEAAIARTLESIRRWSDMSNAAPESAR
jgi:hypothetical protein